jgi:hypothetical protein
MITEKPAHFKIVFIIKSGLQIFDYFKNISNKDFSYTATRTVVLAGIVLVGGSTCILGRV